MVSSTHLPPPVMIDSTAVLAFVTHMLCWSWAMYFCAAASSENDHGSMNLDSNTAPVPSTMPSNVAARNRITGMLDPPLDGRDHLAGVALVPVPIERFGHDPELHDQVAREVLWFGFAALFAPEAEEGGFVVAHDDPGVRAADEIPTRS